MNWEPSREQQISSQTLPTQAQVVLPYTGFFHWLAANGDKFEGSFQGQSCPVYTPGVYDNDESADVDPIASTGRFAGATGHFHLEGRIDFTTVPPSFVLPWEGTISSVGSHKRH